MSERGHDSVDTDVASLVPRVDGVEREIGNIRSQIGSLQSHVDRGFDRMGQQISQELRDRDNRFQQAISEISAKFDDQSESRNTNWSVVIAAVTLGVLIVGAIGSAWVLPLAKADQVHDTQLAAHQLALDALREREASERAELARLEERSKFAVYVGGIKPTKENP